MAIQQIFASGKRDVSSALKTTLLSNVQGRQDPRMSMRSVQRESSYKRCRVYKELHKNMFLALSNKTLISLTSPKLSPNQSKQTIHTLKQ